MPATGKSYPTESEEYQEAVEKAWRKLYGFIAEKNYAPLMLQLMWHSTSTWDVKLQIGDPFGTMRHKQELGHGENNEVDITDKLLAPIKEQFPVLSE